MTPDGALNELDREAMALKWQLVAAGGVSRGGRRRSVSAGLGSAESSIGVFRGGSLGLPRAWKPREMLPDSTGRLYHSFLAGNDAGSIFMAR